MKMPFKVNDLIIPISDEKRSGFDIRINENSTALYYTVKDARNEARNKERKAQFNEEEITTNEEWKIVLTQGIEILKNHSKDLEVTAWVIEALIRKYSIEGLTLGFELITALIDQYWEKLYPLPDEDGVETTVAPLAGLNGIESEGSLIPVIRQIKITDDAQTDGIALWQYQQALATQKGKNIEENNLDEIKELALVSGGEFYTKLVQQTNNCLETFKKLNTLLDGKCGKLAPPCSFINKALNELKDHLGYISKELLLQDEGLAEPVEEDIAQIEPTSAQNNSALKGRTAALAQLKQVAKYFKNAEPHSPIPYLLDRAITWANLPLPLLLKEIINDEKSLSNAFSLTGINQKDKAET